MLIKHKAVLFDMDGTLIDSRHTIEQAWLHAGNAFDVDIKKEDIEEHIHGRSGGYTLDYFFGHLDDSSKARAKKMVDEFEETANTPLISGAIEFLDQLKENNIKMALVTGSWQARIDHVFTLHNLKPYFSAIVHRHDVKEGKPSPEGFVKGASLLDTDPRDCLVFEDSISGFLAAEACGAECVAVGWNGIPRTPNVIESIVDYSATTFEF